MTITPLPAGDGPLYERLADHISALIRAGSLSSGARLPPQRDLADELSTTVGTVGRAYSLLRARDLVTGEVGRGTYIRDFGATEPSQTAPLAPEPSQIALLATIAEHLAAIRQTLDGMAAKDRAKNAPQDGSS